jgi:ABC-type spermidine/putrescine transport system permease subunit I
LPPVSDAHAIDTRKAWTHSVNGWTGLMLAAPLIVLVVLFVLYPLVRVFVEASSGGDPFGRYLTVFTDPISRRALTTTLVDSLIVTAVCLVVGLAIAWTLHTTRSRGIRVLLWTVVLIPMWMGVIVKNYSIFILLSTNGPLNAALQALGLTEQPLSLLYNDFAVVFGISYSLIPYAFLSLYATILNIDTGLLTAAQALGASRLKALATIALPMARGGLVASCSLVFVLAIGFYVTPILLGGPQTAFMATQINNQLNARYDFAGASASAAVLLVIAAAIVGLAVALVGGRTLRRALR